MLFRMTSLRNVVCMKWASGNGKCTTLSYSAQPVTGIIENWFLECSATTDKEIREILLSLYRGADKSLARPGRKQATAAEEFEFHIS